VEGIGPIRGVFIRAPYVKEVGPGVQVLARDGQGHVVAVRSGRHLAVAFHPELAGEPRLHALFLSGLAQEVAPAREAR
jgi:5'-phosphate synthase pdxT subunit